MDFYVNTYLSFENVLASLAHFQTRVVVVVDNWMLDQTKGGLTPALVLDLDSSIFDFIFFVF